MTSPIRSILFPTDLSACAEGAFSHAAFLAERFGASLHVLHVRENPNEPPADWFDTLRISPEDIFADLKMPMPEEDRPFGLIEIEDHEVEASDVSAATLHHAATHSADLIVMGTHGRTGIRRAVIGSIAEAVVRRARCPVLTVRPSARGDESALRRILVALEDAHPRPWQVAWGARLAHAYGSHLDLVHIVALSPLHPGPSPAQRRGHRDLRVLEESLEAEGLRATSRVVEGEPAHAILDTAARLQPDLLVVGSQGKTGMRRALLGSVSERVIREAPCPVFVSRVAPVTAPAAA
ncbi:MAG: universal stress protein [Bacteroidota bacterium]